MPDQQPEQAGTFRYFISRSPQEGAIALIRRHANGDLDLWAPTSMLANLHLEPFDDPRWIPNAWPRTSLLSDEAIFAEIGEGEAERMKPSMQTSATLYQEPDLRPTIRPFGAQAISSGLEFEEHAREVLAHKWGLRLSSRKVTLRGGVSHSFDLVSDDRAVVGDAKWLKDLQPIPAAKLSVIAEYVWLLQNLEGADRRFIVFGQDRAVPERWLARFRPLLDGVEFWFLDNDITRIA